MKLQTKIFLICSFLLALFLLDCSRQKIITYSIRDILENDMISFEEENDIAIVRESLGSHLKLLDGFIKGNPNDKGLLLMASKGYYSYAVAFLEDEDIERACKFYIRSRDYGMRILKQNKQFSKSKNLDEFNAALKSLSIDYLPALFWTASSWGNWVQFNLNNPFAIADLPKVESMMSRVIELDETYYYGGAHIFFGVMLSSKPAMFGGNLNKAKEHFEKAIDISQGKYLLTYIYYAKMYAVQSQDEELFRELLNKVINAPENLLPEQNLSNKIAKERAKKLLENVGEYF